MPDPTPVPPPDPTTQTPATPPPEPPTEFNIGEEFGTAKRNLPPLRIVLAAIAIIAAVVALFAYFQRPRPQGIGAINFVTAVEVPGQHIVLSAVTFTLRNSTDRSLWVRALKAQLTAADGHTYEDEAASAVDLDRYYQTFPPLKESSEPALSPEAKLPPGTEKKGTIIVSFPVTKEAFDQRKSLTVAIQPYDQPVPITLK